MQQVRYFLAVARTLNFTRAAEECHVSQPAMTRAVKQLEAEFGGELIRREGRLTHLTELGRRTLPLIRQCYESATAAKALAQSLTSGETAVLAMAVCSAFDLDLLTEMLGELRRAFPTLQLKLRRGDDAEVGLMLKNGDVEMAIAGPLPEAWERLDAWPMFTEPYVLVAAAQHDLALRNEPELDLDLVRGARLLIHRAGQDSAALLDRLAAVGICVEDAHQVDAYRDLGPLLEANFGVAIAPASAHRSAALRRLALAGFDLQRTVAAYTVAGRPRSREAGTLLNMLRAADWSAAPA